MPQRPPIHRPHRRGRARHRTRRERARKTAARGYDSRWQRASRAYRLAHPLCVECERHGRIQPSTEVDHIVPHRGDPVLFWDESNWQALCHTCHSLKTARGA